MKLRAQENDGFGYLLNTGGGLGQEKLGILEHLWAINMEMPSQKLEVKVWVPEVHVGWEIDLETLGGSSIQSSGV